jgi:hypothetical protein
MARSPVTATMSTQRRLGHARGPAPGPSMSLTPANSNNFEVCREGDRVQGAPARLAVCASAQPSKTLRPSCCKGVCVPQAPRRGSTPLPRQSLPGARRCAGLMGCGCRAVGAFPFPQGAVFLIGPQRTDAAMAHPVPRARRLSTGLRCRPPGWRTSSAVDQGARVCPAGTAMVRRHLHHGRDPRAGGDCRRKVAGRRRRWRLVAVTA